SIFLVVCDNLLMFKLEASLAFEIRRYLIKETLFLRYCGACKAADCSYTAIVCSAILRAENCCLTIDACVRHCLHRVSSVRALHIALAIASESCGSTVNANVAPASGKLETLDVTTGIPHASASVTGMPNPSYKEGYTKTDAE